MVKDIYNGVNDCSESDPCPASPCCLDQWINNNTMAYNADQNSFTYLQIREMLINLNNYKCNYINAIKTDRSCAPPSAFISDPLPGFVNTNPCKTCFDLSASFNEEKYKIKIYKIVNGNEQLVQDRPWITGQAGKICFTNGSNLVSSGSQLLKPNTTYRFELIVGRINTSCLDQNSVSKTFTTSDCNTDEAEEANSGFTNMSVSPNPGIDDIQINFNASLGEDYSIFAIKQSNGQIFELIHSYIPSVNRINTVEIVTSNLDSGSYILFSIGSLQNYYCNWIKL